MRRTLERPTQPERLGRIVAALRVYAGARPPKNATERKINAELRAQKVSKATAKRMVRTFDSMPSPARKSLLGDVARPSYVPPAKPADIPTSPATVTVPTTVFSRVPAEARRAPEGLVREMQGEGPRAKPVYTIRYQGLWCQEESTWDRFSNSDEIYLVTSAVHIGRDGKNVIRTERHPLAQGMNYYEDVDAAEVRVGPIAACWHENTDIDVVSLTVVATEHDEGDPNAWKDEIDTLVKAAVAVGVALGAPGWIASLGPAIAEAINWVVDTDDDPIETQTVVLPRDLLEAYAGQWVSPYIGYKLAGTIGNFTLQPVVTDMYYHFITTHKGGGATYMAGFDVLRDPELEKPVIIL